MSASHVLYEVHERVAVITLNRPELMNAFSDTMREGLLHALQQAESTPEVRCVVLTGAGRAFCAGGDVASMTELQARDDATIIHQRMAVGSQVVHGIRRMPKPVIAAINGAAAGAGINLALACDLRFASDKAQFAESFVKIGLVPDWGGTFLLTHLVGTSKAMELMMTGERIDAAEALRLGILNRIFPDDAFRQEVMNFAGKLARGPAGTLARIKQAIYLGATGTLAESLAYEEQAQGEVFLSPDAKEGMRAFLEKRPPRFS